MDRLEDLASEYFDGELEDAAAAELAALLREDPEKRRQFLALYQQNRLLRLNLGKNSDDTFVDKVLSEVGSDTQRFVKSVMLEIGNESRPSERQRRPQRHFAWMKWAGLAACAALALVAVFLFIPTGRPAPVARVEQISGTVTRGKIALRVGDVLQGPVAIETAASSSAILVYQDKTRLSLGEGTSMVFQPSPGAQKTLHLATGSLKADVARQTADRPFLMRTKQAEAKVLGTKFELATDSDSTRLDVGEGKVKFTRNSDQKSIDVSAGFDATCRDGIDLLAHPKVVLLDLGDGTMMEFAHVMPGTFTMGGTRAPDVTWQADERPEHPVTLTQGYYCGRVPVTRNQFAAFAKTAHYKTGAERNGKAYGRIADGTWIWIEGASWRNLAGSQTDDHPAGCIDWFDAQAFCAWATQITGRAVRLPTEAEWEYACRAGTKSAWSFGDDESRHAAYAWSSNNSGFHSNAVGRKKPNAWGLFEMHGNVWEWCQDWAGPYGGQSVDPIGPSIGDRRILRGGAWSDPALYTRSACRHQANPFHGNTPHGFRVVFEEGSVFPARPGHVVEPEETKDPVHPDPARVKGWSWKLPPDLVTPASEKRNHVFTVGEPVVFWLSDRAASYAVRDDWGRRADHGPAETFTTLRVSEPGWYKLNVYGRSATPEWGDVIGGATFVILRSNPNFPALPAKDTSGGSHPSIDQVMRAITGMGPQRHRINDEPNVEKLLAAKDADVAIDRIFYLPYDPVRERALLMAFSHGTADVSLVRRIVERYKNDIRHWEPRNEPNSTVTATDFVNRELKPFYETVKSVDPKLKVLGPGIGTIGPSMHGWLEEFFRAGGGKYIDALSFHATNCVNGDLWLIRKSLDSLNAILARHGLEKIEKWQTEQGFMAAVFGSYQPRLQGRWTMLQMMVYEQYGIPKERNHLWYDRSHGHWDMPMWWENEDNTLNPAAVLMRVWAEELYGTRFSKAFDFGPSANSIYVGSLFEGSGRRVAAFVSAGDPHGSIELAVQGGGRLHVVSAFGAEQDLPVHAGRIILPVPEIPVYVELAQGQSIDVVPMDWGPNLARAPGVTARSSGSETANASISKILNGTLENWFWEQKPDSGAWTNDAPLPNWVEVRLPAPTRIARVVIHAGVPWQVTGTLQDYELQVEENGAWKTIERIQEPVKSWGVFTPTNRTTVDSFFSDRSMFIHAFRPITTQRIRVLVHQATYGGGASKLVAEAGGQTNAAPSYSLREVEIYGR